MIVTCGCTIFGEENACNLVLYLTNKHAFENMKLGLDLEDTFSVNQATLLF